jgi:hypothetical protein
MILIKTIWAFLFSLLLIFQPGVTLQVKTVEEYNIGAGKQPDIAIDPNGSLRIVYGLENGKSKDLFYVVSRDLGKTFSEPYLMGSFSKMGLGMGRGPQIASTENYTTVTIGDLGGNLFAYRLDHEKNRWSGRIRVNDGDSTALEALSSLDAGKGNNVVAVWLDTRLEKTNNLYGALSRDGGLTWDKNILVYKGAQKGICECCKPSVFIGAGGQIYAMFRNKLDGARNLYLTTSKDNGQHFESAQKLGTADYMINACPMDGGDLTADKKGKVTTVWRRQTDVYLSVPGEAEIKLGQGRTPVVQQTDKGVAIAWEQNGVIQFRSPDGTQTVSLGNGQYPKLALMPNQEKIICTFEREGRIIVKLLSL